MCAVRFVIVIHARQVQCVRDVIINQRAPVRQVYQGIHTLNVAVNLTKRNVRAIQIVRTHWLVLIGAVKIHAHDRIFVIDNKPVRFWIRNRFAQLYVNVHQTQLATLKAIVKQSDMMILAAVRMTNALIQINVFRDRVYKLAHSTDAVLTLNAYRNNIVACARAHQDIQEMHTLNARQVSRNNNYLIKNG